MYGDRQTSDVRQIDVRQHYHLMSSLRGRGHNDGDVFVLKHNVCRQIVAQHLLLKNWMPVVAILDVFLTSLFQNIDVQGQFSLDTDTSMESTIYS